MMGSGGVARALDTCYLILGTYATDRNLLFSGEAAVVGVVKQWD